MHNVRVIKYSGLGEIDLKHREFRHRAEVVQMQTTGSRVLEPARRPRQLHLLQRSRGKVPRRLERARKLLTDSAELFPVVFFGRVLDSQLEGVEVASELLQEGNDVPSLAGEVQLPQLRTGSSSRLVSPPDLPNAVVFLTSETPLSPDSSEFGVENPDPGGISSKKPSMSFVL